MASHTLRDGTRRELSPDWWGMGIALAGNAPAEGSGGSAKARSLIAQSQLKGSPKTPLSAQGF